MSGSIRMVELFAGVGGFRLGLEGYDNPDRPEFHMDPAGPFHTVWANQWEPDGRPARQFAWECYERRFGHGSCDNEDITVALDRLETGDMVIPDFDMLVGGFPCQDYSVARTLASAGGIEGRKGVLWWQIRRLLDMRRPRYVLLENVDRLLKSPAKQRGRDFAIILSCLDSLGYQAEWRVINAADYGMPQKRKRTYIYAELADDAWDAEERMKRTGVITRAFPATMDTDLKDIAISGDLMDISERFGIGTRMSVFANAGVLTCGHAMTAPMTASYNGPRVTLGDILEPDSAIPEQFIVNEDKIERWKYCKGAKRKKRIAKDGHEYIYSERSMLFPDKTDRPSRTILTDEGGAAPSRTKHAVAMGDGRIRRLVPDELDQLQMFPRGWTDTGMGDGHRAFCMGNALVTGIPHAIGKIIASDHDHAR